MLSTIRTAAARLSAWIWRQRHRTPLTPLGLTIAGLGYWIGFDLARAEADFVLRAAGLTALCFVGLALAAVAAAGLGLRLALRRSPAPPPLELEAGAARATGLELPALSWAPLIHLSLSWEVPREVEVTLVRGLRRDQELIRPLRRGAHPRVLRRLVVGDT